MLRHRKKYQPSSSNPESSRSKVCRRDGRQTQESEDPRHVEFYSANGIENHTYFFNVGAIRFVEEYCGRLRISAIVLAIAHPIEFLAQTGTKEFHHFRGETSSESHFSFVSPIKVIQRS